jgi:hypothetical protein
MKRFNDGWAQKFSIPGEKMSRAVMNIPHGKKQLSSSDKNRMVKIVVEEARNVKIWI